MTYRKFLSLGAIFALFFTIVPASFQRVFAADSAPSCNLSQDKFDAIKNIENDTSLAYLQKIKDELAIRKQLLTETVDCAISEAEYAKAGVDGISSKDLDVLKLRSQYSGQLNDAVDYYKLQESKISDLGLQGSKDFAANLAGWRASNYEPLAERANNLILSYNRPATAWARSNRQWSSLTLLAIIICRSYGKKPTTTGTMPRVITRWLKKACKYSARRTTP